jgi:V8-like Glu-specific endopeptidase
MKLYLSAAVLSFVAVSNAQAVQFPIFGNYLQANVDGEGSEAGFDFRGIVDLSNCSGSIVRFDDSKDTDNAMVLSNGHCVDLLKPGVVITNKPIRKSFSVLAQDAQRLGSVSGDKILYATMTSTDASLFLLKETFQGVEEKFGFKALTLSRQAPTVGTSIEIISGYWKRGYACQIETYVHTLKEADWTFVDSIRYSRPGCNTIGGTSGSPVIEAGTRTVIAVNNTGNESGKLCEMNNPCEVAEDGTRVAQKGYSYGQQTYWFYTCRNDAGAIDLNKPGCMLPK